MIIILNLLLMPEIGGYNEMLSVILRAVLNNVNPRDISDSWKKVSEN